MKKLSIIFTLCISLFFACKKQVEDDVQVKITINNLKDTTLLGRKYIIDETRFYLSNFQLININGNAENIKDIVIVKNDKDNSFTFNLPSGTFSAFNFSFGLDKNTNNSNPNSFDDTHPLSTKQDMFWGMLKYRFIVTEGKIDTSIAKNQTPIFPVSMHLGTDTLYRVISTTIANNKLKRGSIINISVNLNKLFVLDKDTFDFNSFSNHSDVSQIPRAITIVDSLVNGIKTDIFSPN
jgi:hypothetical protein